LFSSSKSETTKLFVEIEKAFGLRLFLKMSDGVEDISGTNPRANF
jgi:hypothetical protein